MTTAGVLALFAQGGTALNNLDLDGLDLAGIDFTGADFTGSSFRGTTFTLCTLTNCNFTNCDLTGTDFSMSIKTNIVITGATTTWARGLFGSPPSKAFYDNHRSE
jgi:uncharacterized protein YjbI with pentapeptide repeats